MNKILLILCVLGMHKISFAQPYLPLTAGSGNALTGEVHILKDHRASDASPVTGTNGIYHYLHNTGGDLVIGLNNSTGGSLFTSGGIGYAPAIYTNNNLPIQFGTNGVVRQTINGNGNVGIGTTSPDSKLTVAGKIHSQEVKVTVNAGADFVFDKEYKLRSLAETEQYITANRHLPEIVSADEMKKNGLELGEMNIKLLQKIEELTLYLIELNKTVQTQKKEINQLKSKL